MRLQQNNDKMMWDRYRELQEELREIIKEIKAMGMSPKNAVKELENDS